LLFWLLEEGAAHFIALPVSAERFVGAMRKRQTDTRWLVRYEALIAVGKLVNAVVGENVAIV
jgi:hypothetical protein